MPTRIIENPDTFRIKIRQRLATFFKDSPNAEKHATNLEKGVHNWSLKEANFRKVVKKWDNPFFVQLYLDHLRSVYNNLKNEKIVQNVLSGEIRPHEIAFMTHQELMPEKWEELIKAKSIRDKNKFEQKAEAMTDSFTCRKCKSKECTYTQAQTRSADEGITTFVSCTNCGNRWKIC
jgi:transcription elongation factor S-II